jgi:hypothetical protein
MSLQISKTSPLRFQNLSPHLVVWRFVGSGEASGIVARADFTKDLQKMYRR